MPVLADRAAPPTVSNTGAIWPGTDFTTTFPIADVTFDGPYVGSLKQISTLAWKVPFGIYTLYKLTNVPPPALVDFNETVTFTDELYVGPRLVWRSSESIIIPNIFDTSGQAVNPQAINKNYKGAHVASQQFNPELDLLPGQQIRFASSVTINGSNSSAGSIEYGYAFGYNFFVTSGVGQTTGLMNIDIGYNPVTINPDRSLNGPVF